MTFRQEISDESWAVLAPLFPMWKGVGRPILDMRRTLEGIAWRFRTGCAVAGHPGAVRELELDLLSVLRLVEGWDLVDGAGDSPGGQPPVR